MSVRTHLLFTYASAAVTILAPVIATPAYARELGPQAWGLVSFALLVQLGATLLEQGFSQSVMKELTLIRTSAPFNLPPVIRGLQRWYLGGATALAALVACAAPPLSQHLHHSSGLPVGEVLAAICLAALMVASQLPGALYRAVLLSAERHTLNSGINIAAQCLRHGVGLMLVHWLARPIALIAWFGIAALLETLLRWFTARVVLAEQGNGAPESNEATARPIVRSTIKTSTKMSGAVLLGTFTVYADRFVVGQSLSLEALGHYTIAATAALGAVQAIYPLGQIALPKLIAARHDRSARHRINLRLCQAILGVAGVIGLIFALQGERLTLLWLRSPALCAQILPLLNILLWGTLCNALFNIGYWNWLADGAHHAILRTYSICIVISFASAAALVSHYGLMGAAIGWVAANAACLVCSLGWLTPHKKYAAYA